jgi:kynurenine formamidase
MVKIIDLSATIESGSVSEPWPAKIDYVDHREGTVEMGEKLGAKPEHFVYSNGVGWSYEWFSAMTHCGTHLDAPWHFHPITEGKLSKTIDEVPLEWCFSDGVVLDMRHKKPHEEITVDDIKLGLEKINYTIKPFDIVLIMTGCDKKIGTTEYFIQPGMSRDATLWILDQGVKIIGVDSYGYDRAFSDMAEELKKTGDGHVIWPAHFAGIEKEYCHIEKLVNLDLIPKPFGFKFASFPIKIRKGSAAWIRPVAIIEEP